MMLIKKKYQIRFSSWNHFLSVVWRIFFDMDILREFLESSTIHGLSYISTPKVRGGNNMYDVDVSIF